MFWRYLFLLFKLIVIGVTFIMVAAPEWPAFQDERYQLNAIVAQRHFDFLVWELNALRLKGEASLTAGHNYLDEQRRKEIVLNYLELARLARQLEREISAIYTNPEIDDSHTASRVQQREVAAIRRELARLQPLAEAIVQEQVADVLLDEGFGFLGRIWPPVQMHMTPLPSILIVSPRDEIYQLYGIPLEHGLPVSMQEELEDAVFDTIHRSALVVPIGGLGIYPAMIVETTDINYLADVVAHEWSHHWLTLRPLGARYAVSPAMRTINETVASLFGKEIGERVVERYYPELKPEPRPPLPPPAPADPEAPPPFDFRAHMHETRVNVDRLLSEGRIEEAEAYMEAQRRFFLAHGYVIRKLNQAYFAFYGAYADTPGATGEDPIGPTVVAIWEQSPSLRAFMDQVATVTSFEALQDLAATLQVEK